MTEMRPVWDAEYVKPDEVLWRYFSTKRLVEALQSNCLYFPSARQFDDRFEGAVAVLPHDFPVDPRYDGPDFVDKAFKELCRLTKISCWHRAEYESAAMWQLYANSSKGIALTTTAERLRTALQPFRLAPEYGEEVPYWGPIRYVDLHAVKLNVGMEQRFFYKHLAFEWEREFRVAITLRMAEESGVHVPDDGINVPFDPDELIESIFLGPELSKEDRNTVTQVCSDISLKARLMTSTLLGRPRYY